MNFIMLNLLELEVMRMYVKKYKGFLPIEYVDKCNEKIKKKVSIYLIFTLLMNLVIYTELSKEVNIMNKNMNILEVNERENIKHIGSDLIEKTYSLNTLIHDEGILKLNIEKENFEMYVLNEYLYDILEKINLSKGEVYEITYDDKNFINFIRGVF